ncbi:MAG: helix-turn-helix domain-containing protein [Solirubrobacterales bacterium]|nr:helix-turn-helix domain-containing protein [Solirubrobacterales bacterium]
MAIRPDMSDHAILREIGDRIKDHRLEQDVSQRGLAGKAGVSLSTLERVEAGAGSSMVSVVRILRALGLAGNLDELVPEPLPSPLARLKASGRKRQRAS